MHKQAKLTGKWGNHRAFQKHRKENLEDWESGTTRTRSMRKD